MTHKPHDLNSFCWVCCQRASNLSALAQEKWFESGQNVHQAMLSMVKIECNLTIGIPDLRLATEYIFVGAGEKKALLFS